MGFFVNAEYFAGIFWTIEEELISGVSKLNGSET